MVSRRVLALSDDNLETHPAMLVNENGPNHSVEANRRPAAPLGVGYQFGSSFSARPDLPAAVAHLGRSAMGTHRTT